MTLKILKHSQKNYNQVQMEIPLPSNYTPFCNLIEGVTLAVLSLTVTSYPFPAVWKPFSVIMRNEESGGIGNTTGKEHSAFNIGPK